MNKKLMLVSLVLLLIVQIFLLASGISSITQDQSSISGWFTVIGNIIFGALNMKIFFDLQK